MPLTPTAPYATGVHEHKGERKARNVPTESLSVLG
jgi:hypothetical protein